VFEDNLAIIGLVAARIFALLTVLPFDSSINGGRRLFLALCFAVPFCGIAGSDVTVSAFALCRELLIGLLVGTPVRVLVESAEMLGEIIDTGRGQTIGSVMDPLNGQQGSELAKVFRVGALCLFIQVGGLERFIDAVGASFSLMPINTSVQSIDGVRYLLHGGVHLVATTLSLSASWLASFLLVDTFLAAIARVSQGFSFSSTSMWLKFIATAVLLLNLAYSPDELYKVMNTAVDWGLGSLSLLE
jgi:flagellar biosynthesis protein FliR